MPGGKWIDQLLSMMQSQQGAAAPERQGFAERLVSAGRPDSTNVYYGPRTGSSGRSFQMDARARALEQMLSSGDAANYPGTSPDQMRGWLNDYGYGEPASTGRDTDAVKFENEIGLPTALPMDFTQNAPLEPGITEEMYPQQPTGPIVFVRPPPRPRG